MRGLISPAISRASFLLKILKFIPHLITSFLPHLYSNQNINWAAPPPSSASSTSPLLSAPAPCSPPGAGRAAQLTSALQCVCPYRTLYFSDCIFCLDHCIYNCDNRILHKGVISKSLYRLFNTEIHKKERPGTKKCFCFICVCFAILCFLMKYFPHIWHWYASNIFYTWRNTYMRLYM